MCRVAIVLIQGPREEAPQVLSVDLWRRRDDCAAGDVVMMLMVPLFIWIFVSFRRDDIKMIVDRTRLRPRSVNHVKPTALLPR